MARRATPRKRARGSVDVLQSGSLRVRVYAGKDPLTARDLYLIETIPPGPEAAAQAEAARTRLLAQVDAKLNARTAATVNELLDRYLKHIDVESNTRDAYESLARIHIRPLIGDLPLSKLDGEVQDSFYLKLRTCRAHCKGKKFIQHRTVQQHECDDRCKPHKCEGLSKATIRKIRAVLSGAGKRAVRWRWIGVNPFDQAEPQSAPKPAPNPPSSEQAAAIVTEAWADADWGMLIWLAMVTGARRGEICALSWRCFDSDSSVLTIASSIAQRGGRTWEKDTKTHQQRRITLDAQTVALLAAYRRQCAESAELDDMPDGARIFANGRDRSSWLKPDSVSQRYTRMCKRLGWNMHIHQLRHYSATELISSGVDITTVSGRLGHGGGGSTTLRFYSAWKSEADQRAAGSLATRMPKLPGVILNEGAIRAAPNVLAGEHPYQRITADLRGAITCGALQVGDLLPTVAELANRYSVSYGTAQRAIANLRTAGLVNVSKGRRAVVINAAADSGASFADVVGLDAARKRRS